MQDKVAYDWRCEEARESENVRDGIDILMRSKLSQDLEEGFLRLGKFRFVTGKTLWRTFLPVLVL